MKKIIFLLTLVHLIVISAYAQTTGDIIKAKAGEGARQGAEIAVEKTADKVTDKALDKLFGGKKNKKNHGETSNSVSKQVADTSTTMETKSSQPNSLKTYSKFEVICIVCLLFLLHKSNFNPIKWCDCPGTCALILNLLEHSCHKQGIMRTESMRMEYLQPTSSATIVPILNQFLISIAS